MATKRVENMVNAMQNVVSEDVLHTYHRPYNKKEEKTTNIDGKTLIAVKSNTYGSLIYVNNRNGESFVWDKAGQVQLISLDDLRTIKQSHIAFFRNQWIIILGVGEAEEANVSVEDIYRSIGAASYYKNIVDITDIETILKWTPKQIAEKAFLLSPIAKNNMTAMLHTYVQNGVIDSISAVRAFEEALGCSFTVNSN